MLFDSLRATSKDGDLFCIRQFETDTFRNDQSWCIGQERNRSKKKERRSGINIPERPKVLPVKGLSVV
jgi:hypothetical protein